jgi:hypothetical protein
MKIDTSLFFIVSMTEYKIIEEEFSDRDKCTTLIKEIRTSIYHGWQPAGDLCISCDGETTWIAQSMIKKQVVL